MPEVSPREIAEIIKKHYPNAKGESKDLGKSPSKGQEMIDRFVITVTIKGLEVSIAGGENLVFMINRQPIHAIRYFPLAPRDSTLATVELWMKEIPKYKKKPVIPLVSQYTRKYLGKEESAEPKSHSNYIYYPLYYLVITEHSITLVLRSTKRVAYHWEINEHSDFEKIFRFVQTFVESIKEGNIR